MKPVLVVVTGRPGSGKSTLARRLAADLRLPVFDRDDFKDTLFDVFGWSDIAWSRRVGGASWELVYLVAERVLAAGSSLVCDSNFDRRRHPERLSSLRDRHSCVLVEVWCRVSDEVAEERFRRRWEEGGRHPGHVSDQWLADRPEPVAGEDEYPTGVADHLIEVDTSAPDSVDYRSLIEKLRTLLGG